MHKILATVLSVLFIFTLPSFTDIGTASAADAADKATDKSKDKKKGKDGEDPDCEWSR